MINDRELQQDVQNAIKWEPAMHAAEIGVTAKEGIITLSGTVDSYSKKVNAERATKNVTGVRAIAEGISIEYGNSATKNDTEIAKDILHAFQHNWEVPDSKIQVKVENGWVTLEGEVAWKYQEEAAKDAIINLTGVKGINNLITVKSDTTDIVEKEKIESALKRNWSIDAREIQVEVDKNKVTLTGLVYSLYQKDEAGRLAWNTPGVAAVENELAVIYA